MFLAGADAGSARQWRMNDGFAPLPRSGAVIFVCAVGESVGSHVR